MKSFVVSFVLLFVNVTLAFGQDPIHAEESRTPLGTPGSSPLSCSFSQSFCGWDSAGFSRVTTLKGITRPLGVTFAAADASASQLQDYVLRSHVIAVNSPSQISFRYVVLNPPTYSETFTAPHFGLYAVSSDGSRRTLWELTNYAVAVPVGTWLPARVNFCLGGSFTLEIRVTERRTDANQQRISVGLSDFVINNEKNAVSSNVPTSNGCIPQPVSQSAVTCQIDALTSTTFCGWQSRSNWLSQGYTSLISGPDPLSGDIQTVYFVQAAPPATSAAIRTTTLVSAAVDTTLSVPGLLSFWYQRRGCRVDLILMEDNRNTTVMTLDENTAAESQADWRFVVYQVPATSARLLKFSLNIQYDNTAPSAFFSFNRVWYSTEPGYQPDSLSDGQTTATTVVPGESTTSSASQDGLVKDIVISLFAFFLILAAN